jgi:hypothetical protein
MRNITIFTLLVLLALAGGCNQSQKAASVAGDNTPRTAGATAATTELTPEELGELGAQIRKSPDRASDLLTQHGLTAKSFEAQIRKTTENPDASKRYAAAYRKASA